MVLNWMHVQVQSDRSDRLDEALAPAAPQGLLVFAGRGELDVQRDAGKGVDIASVLPRRIMGTGTAAPWGKEGDECAICLGEMVAGEKVSDLPGCKHTFHEQCVTKWLHTKAAAGRSCCCPACNSLIACPASHLVAFSDHPQPAAETQAAPYFCSDFTNSCKMYTSVVLGLLALGVAIYCISQW